jgi:tetratricopeptide (TPR) repeat protein
MKKYIVAAILLLSTKIHAQDLLNCNLLCDHGSKEKAKNCILTAETKTPNSTFLFYKMIIAVKIGDSTLASLAMEQQEANAGSDFYFIATKTMYYVFTQNLEAAKATFDAVLKNHKPATVQEIIKTVNVFIQCKYKDPNYVLLWLNALEKEIKQPNAEWLMLKGDYYSAIGDYGNALNFYNKVIDAESSNDLAVYKKAVAYRKIKNALAALTELETALQLRPEFPLAILEKGEVLFELNKVEDAINNYNSYFVLVPNDLQAHLQLGASLFSSKRFNDASKEADYVINKEPGNISALKLKSYSSYELANYSEGLSLLLSYLEKADSLTIQSRDYEFLAHFYQKTGSDSLAIVSFKKAINFPVVKAELYSEAGSLMVKKSRYDDAYQTYTQKLLRYSCSSADYFNFGRSALALEKFEMADTLFGKVCEMQPTWPNGFLMRANANAHLDPGSTEGKALPFYEKFVLLAENDSVNTAKLKNGLIESYKYLGYYYFLKKEVETSKTYWKKVLLLDPEDKQAKDVIKQL